MSRLLELADEYAYCKALIGVGVGADKAAKADIHAAVRRCDAARAALVAEIERVEREAVRYRFLREHDNLWGGIEMCHNKTYPERMDAAIDAAMKGQK